MIYYCIFDEESTTNSARTRLLHTCQLFQFDNILSEQLTNHLFQAKNHSFGMDLVALNVQRGRDHGLPGYNAFREVCGMKKVDSFDYFADFIPEKIVDRLKLIYAHPDDVDLFIGGISEIPVHGALLGPTFQCLVGDQFKRLKFGDRFWFEETGQPNSFTEGKERKSRCHHPMHCLP